ncbi:hypothetical protein [Hespellia stercorisuis]|uniref:hypothetical protein n=1 Tax=Hespellia stercorisuis TaxID=180311 RepID=UPI00135646B2|nr:hypothetical protein [Hespellia stercorisuis]
MRHTATSNWFAMDTDDYVSYYNKTEHTSPDLFPCPPAAWIFCADNEPSGIMLA